MEKSISYAQCGLLMTLRELTAGEPDWNESIGWLDNKGGIFDSEFWADVIY